MGNTTFSDGDLALLINTTRTNLAVEANIKSRTKAEVPKEMDAKRIGDTQLEVELKLPADAPRGSVGINTTGVSGRTATP